MSFDLTSNFLLNARGLTFTDGGGITWAFNKNTNTVTATASATGTLSSVGLSDASTAPIYAVGSSPLTANGTLTLTLNVQAKNLAFMGPATGSNAQPTFRALVAADIPTLSYVTSIGSSNLSIGGTTAVPTVNLSSTQVTNIGLGATALQSATTADSIQGAGTPASPIELVGDAATPGNSKYYGTNGSGTRGWYTSATVPTVANPTGTIGLTAVNGSTGNWMDAGSAPKISQAIAPTWTAQHVFSAAAAGEQSAVQLSSSEPSIGWNNTAAATDTHQWDAVAGASNLQFRIVNDANSAAVNWLTVTRVATTSISLVFGGPVGFNGNAAPAQSTGWGTSTNGAVVANYNASLATLLQTADVVAQFITIFKALGFLGA